VTTPILNTVQKRLFCMVWGSYIPNLVKIGPLMTSQSCPHRTRQHDCILCSALGHCIGQTAHSAVVISCSGWLTSTLAHCCLGHVVMTSSRDDRSLQTGQDGAPYWHVATHAHIISLLTSSFFLSVSHHADCIVLYKPPVISLQLSVTIKTRLASVYHTQVPRRTRRRPRSSK